MWFRTVYGDKWIDRAISLMAENGAISLSGDHSVYAGSGEVTLTAGDDLTVESMVDGTNLALTAGQDIHVGQYLVSNDTQ